jgi:hypothetical protein
MSARKGHPRDLSNFVAERVQFVAGVVSTTATRISLKSVRIGILEAPGAHRSYTWIDAAALCELDPLPTPIE